MAGIENCPFVGNLVADIETAKGLIGRYPRIDLSMLLQVATDRHQPVPARVAAIYTLGFTDDDGVSGPVLAWIVMNSMEPELVRDHATEALGYLLAESRSGRVLNVE